MNKKLEVAHAFADMLQAINIGEVGLKDGANLLILNSAIKNIRECVWSLIDCNKTEQLESVMEYMKKFDTAVTEALPFIHTQTTDDNQRDAVEKRLQGIALVINGLKLLVESR